MSTENLFGLPPLESASVESDSKLDTEATQEASNTDTIVLSSIQKNETNEATPSFQPPNFDFKTSEEHIKAVETSQPQTQNQTPEQFEQVNNQFNSYFEYNPMQAVLQGLSAGYKINLSDEQKTHLNQKYLELFDSDPVAAQAWSNQIAFIEHQQIMKQQETDRQAKVEVEQKIIHETRSAVDEITKQLEYFKDPTFNDFLFDLANDLAERDESGKYTDAGDYFREAAQLIHKAYDMAEKRGYERAKAEYQKKTSAYVEGSGNLVPPRSSKDDLNEAIESKDLDLILAHKLRNLKKPN